MLHNHRVKYPSSYIRSGLHGGAKYLRYLLDLMPASIEGDERLYMALAAYNQGIGHLDDARALTRRLKGDANSWKDVSKTFPLLARQEYYSKATYGYSRGWEPVTFVKNVLNYQKILAFKETQQQLRIATSNPGDELNFSDTAQTKSALENTPRAYGDKSWINRNGDVALMRAYVGPSE